MCFLTEELIANFVTYTELIRTLPKVIGRIEETQQSLFQLWTDLTVDELWTYLAIQLTMGIVHKPNKNLYGSKDTLNTPIFSRLMRRDRLERIRKMLYDVNNPLEENYEDSLCKLEGFLDALRSSFSANYTPSQHFAVDEYLSLWKGRLGFKMYIPSKRERYGIKIYMLCESSIGYPSNFIVYCGADTSYPEPSSISLPKPFDDYKNPSKVVLSLMEGFYNKGYNLALDKL